MRDPKIFIVNLSLTQTPPVLPDDDCSEEAIRRLIESRLAGSDVQVGRISVFRGVDAE